MKPEDTLVIVQSYPDFSLPKELVDFLYVNPKPASVENIKVMCGSGHDIVQMRNRAVRDIVLKTPQNIQSIILFDRDNRPSMPDMDLFLKKDADIVGAMYDVPNMKSFAMGGVHCGCLKIKRHVFEKMPAPWFLFGYTPDGCDLLQCECSFFTTKARNLGFSVEIAGYCGHYKTMKP